MCTCRVLFLMSTPGRVRRDAYYNIKYNVSVYYYVRYTYIRANPKSFYTFVFRHSLLVIVVVAAAACIHTIQ